MDFSIMFWGDVNQVVPERKYSLLLDAARYADDNGYVAVWIPERHFHPFGGLYPNPATAAAALAVCTKNIRLRAGSVVVPLHHPLRVFEEWSFVDNLSHGRVEVAIASGWHANDFILAPERYASRTTSIWESLQAIQSLWAGEPYVGRNGDGLETSVHVYPRPLQTHLPIWVTSAGGMRTITSAGRSGVNLLTHLLGQDETILGTKIRQYQAHRVRAGLEANTGKVALMLHTLLGRDVGQVKELARRPFKEYLKQAAHLSVPAEQRQQWGSADDSIKEELAELAFERYFEGAALMGTPAKCRSMVQRLSAIGVTEICCLIDFGVSGPDVMEGLDYLTELKRATAHV